MRAVYDYFAPADDFSWLDVIDLVESNPELTLINSGVEQKHIEQG